MEDIKGHKAYIQILKQMTPSQKLQKVFEMSQFAKDLFYQGLKRRFPELSEKNSNNCILSESTNVTIAITKNLSEIFRR